jgi:hypothetical protein
MDWDPQTVIFTSRDHHRQEIAQLAEALCYKPQGRGLESR